MKQETSSSEMKAPNATADPRRGRRCFWVCTSTDHAGGSAQGQKDKEPQREPPWGQPPRETRGKQPREKWRKRGGARQRKEGYNLWMAHQARNKGRGKGRPSDDAWF